MNTRLRLSKYFLTQEKITLFGQQFQLADKDLNMDNSYVFALMTYGAVVFVLLMIAYFFTIRNLVKENRRKELAITLGFLIAGISEPFLFNTSFKNVSRQTRSGGRTLHGLESVRWATGVFRKMLRQRNWKKNFCWG